MCACVNLNIAFFNLWLLPLQSSINTVNGKFCKMNPETAHPFVKLLLATEKATEL